MFSKAIFLVHQNAALCCIVLEVQNLSKAFVEISNHGVTDFYTSYNAEKEPFWKHSGEKGESDSDHQFLLCPQSFLSYQRKLAPFKPY